MKPTGDDVLIRMSMTVNDAIALGQIVKRRIPDGGVPSPYSADETHRILERVHLARPKWEWLASCTRSRGTMIEKRANNTECAGACRKSGDPAAHSRAADWPTGSKCRMVRALVEAD